MSGIQAAQGGASAAASAPPPTTDADALIQGATSHGQLDAHILGGEVAKLPPGQQAATIAALSGRLTPLQRGQLAHGLASAQTEASAAVGPSACPAGSHVVRMRTTGYDNGVGSTGKRPGDPGYGQTADQSTAGHGTIAAPKSFALGSQMNVPGYGSGTVHDRGGGVQGAHIDLWFPSAAAARQWGSRMENVEVCDPPR